MSSLAVGLLLDTLQLHDGPQADSLRARWATTNLRGLNRLVEFEGVELWLSRRLKAIGATGGARVIDFSDRTFEMHRRGKIEVTNTIGLGGTPEDPMAKGVQDMKDFESGNANRTPDLPDYTLTAKILENRAAAGGTRQVSYIFQMSLTDTRSGRGVWEGEETITKQGQKNTVGF